MDTDRGIGGAGAARNETDAGAAGQFAIGVGHVGGAAFLTADYEFDLVLRFVKGIEHRQITFAGHAEGHVHAMYFEGVYQQLTAGAGQCRIRRFHGSFRVVVV